MDGLDLDVVGEHVARRRGADRIPRHQDGIAMIAEDRARLAPVLVVDEQHGGGQGDEAIVGAGRGDDALDLGMAGPQARDRDAAEEEDHAVADSALHRLKIEIVAVGGIGDAARCAASDSRRRPPTSCGCRR